MSTVKSACILCECNCGIEVTLDGRRLSKISGDKEHPASAGYTCEKALRLDRYQNGRDRLSSPLRRRPDGSYEEIDWDTAITEIARRLEGIRDTHGGDKIFFYGGGGQGNHLGTTYNRAFQAALGARYYSNALAQEKTGEMWVDGKLYGGHTKGDFEHAEVVVFVGKNPWQSHSFPRARPTLRQISADPARSMVVIDPKRTETADLADFHLQVKPGTDAWCLAALLGVLVQEDLVDKAFLAEHTTGADAVLAELSDVDVPAFADACGVPEDLIRSAARRIGFASSVCTYEDLGIQQSIHSTLCSYLNKLQWILTGNFGKPGAMYLHSSFVALAGSNTSGAAKPSRVTPVTGARIIAGLVPCNSIAEEILTDHPDRFRAMWLDSVNPAHSLADSPTFRRALDALDLVVVVDVAFTETARHADYVLPAASQFEKCEATFFNVEFPRNAFQLRAPLFDPLPGTMPEPEIYARLIRELGTVGEETLARLRAAAREDYAQAFFTEVAADPRLMGLAPYVLYETLGPKLPPGMAGAASLWGAAHLCAQANPDSVRRAGFTGEGLEPGEKLFEAVLTRRSGVTFTVDEWEHVWNYVRREDRRFTIALPELLAELRALDGEHPGKTSAEFPFVLSAGERRAFTANTIFRDPGWRRRDTDGALFISPADAERLGVSTGDHVTLTTARGSIDTPIAVNDRMQPGHLSLPNGMGVDYPAAEADPVHGARFTTGVAPNELTNLDWRDPFAGTPWHKHVPAKLEPVRG
ncbi:molybdopterin-dependent oxidoreductase [Amycolatopsis sp. NPDC059657]|uniref:molybdopterin-dependent oxidoreductase n=1 Tax=Amycolatopsis sp. NPDC059657 TaxID=3346899 RepID=UPI00366F7359